MQMFLMMAAGLLLRRCGAINEAGIRCLSDVVMKVLLPCNIICAYLGRDLSIFSRLAWVLLISTVHQLLTWGLSLLLWRSCPQEQRAVLRYGLQFSNSGFIGLPVTESFYGTEGLLCASAFILPINAFAWTVGLSAFIRERSSWRAVVLHTVTHPCMLAAFLGFFLMLAPFPLPGCVTAAMSSFSQGLSPVALLLVGSILADADVKSIFRRDVVILSLVRLLGIPLLVWSVCRLLPMPSIAVQVSVLLTGMPIGSMTAILALSYRCDDVLASNCVVFSTLLSLVTLPVLYLMMGPL